MSAKARAAGRCRDDSTGLDKDLSQAFLDALKIDLLSRRDHDRAHAVCDMAAFQDRGCDTHVLDAAIGARTDHSLLNLDMAKLINGLGIFRQMRAGNGRAQSGQIDLVSLLIFGIRVCLEYRYISVYAALDISHCLVINRENAILGAGLDRHITDREAVIHREFCNTVAGEFH